MLPSPDGRDGSAEGGRSWFGHRHMHDCDFSEGMARQMAFGDLLEQVL